MSRSLVLCFALVATVSRAQDGAAAIESSLTVVTYNVHGLPSFVTGDDTPGRMRLISPLLGAFDLVGLQEDFMPDAHALLMGAVRHAARGRFDRTLTGRFYGSGLTFLADRRVVLEATEHFEAYSGVIDGANDGMASKGIHLARVELAPGVELDLWNTHMDAGGGKGDIEARAAQLVQIEAALRARSAGRAILFIGDTNLNEKRPADQAALARFLEATGLRCACVATREGCCARIDRILWRSGIGVELRPIEWGVAPGFTWEQGKPLSDHEPIRAVIRWRRAPV